MTFLGIVFFIFHFHPEHLVKLIRIPYQINIFLPCLFQYSELNELITLPFCASVKVPLTYIDFCRILTSQKTHALTAFLWVTKPRWEQLFLPLMSLNEHWAQPQTSPSNRIFCIAAQLSEQKDTISETKPLLSFDQFGNVVLTWHDATWC